MGGDFGRVAEANGELEPMNDAKPVTLVVASVGFVSETLSTGADELPAADERADSGDEADGKDGEVGDALLNVENMFWPLTDANGELDEA
jgi:hypothetical protein